MQEIDQRDRELLAALQSDVPLSSTPYAIIGQQIEMSEKEVIKRIDRLKREGLVRQISAVFDPRALGYRSSLVAARVNPDAIERSASIINVHPGVYQNYRRNHDFNLWFTIAVPPNSRLGLERTVELLGREAECQAVRLLPAVKTYKSPSGEAAADSHEEGASGEAAAPPSGKEIEMIQLLQKDLPLHPRPFDALSRTSEVSGEDLLRYAREFADRGQLRRLCAIVTPRRSSFSASALGVWKVPAADADKVGAQMAAHKSVSGCYLRPVYEDWPYNLFTIVHGRSVDECESILNELSDESKIDDRQALFPVKEYKRSRIAFFANDVESWEAQRTGGGAERSAVS